MRPESPRQWLFWIEAHALSVIFFATLLAAVTVPFIQTMWWLKSGYWTPIPFIDAYLFAGLPPPVMTDWEGFNQIMVWFFTIHASIGILLCALPLAALIHFVFQAFDLFPE